MQLIPLEDLKKLQTTSLDESGHEIAPGFSFKSICDVYKNKKSELHKNIASSKLLVQKLYNWLNFEVLKDKCPPIMLVGSGSSRTAYACLGGKCLKVAKNEAGIAQNAQEFKHTKKHWWQKNYACFVQTYESNGGNELLLSECCAKVERPQQLADAFGMNDIDVLRAVVKAICDDKKHDISSASSSLKTMATNYRKKDSSYMREYANVADFAANWLDNLNKTQHSKMNPGQKSFYQLVIFWKKNGISELLPGDVINDENWGFAIRNGTIAPVMIDVGFSKNVANQFYH